MSKIIARFLCGFSWAVTALRKSVRWKLTRALVHEGMAQRVSSADGNW
ncbi:MAG: hypothetical protein FD153_1147 [Rhodospirillaceae bacterium]|nr:MAG: hypothetical protein FD153_1147 [Rhodospirillaceae bacterium]